MIRMSQMKLTGIGNAHTEPRRLQTGVAPGTDATSSIFFLFLVPSVSVGTHIRGPSRSHLPASHEQATGPI